MAVFDEAYTIYAAILHAQQSRDFVFAKQIDVTMLHA